MSSHKIAERRSTAGKAAHKIAEQLCTRDESPFGPGSLA